MQVQVHVTVAFGKPYKFFVADPISRMLGFRPFVITHTQKSGTSFSVFRIESNYIVVVLCSVDDGQKNGFTVR